MRWRVVVVVVVSGAVSFSVVVVAGSRRRRDVIGRRCVFVKCGDVGKQWRFTLWEGDRERFFFCKEMRIGVRMGRESLEVGMVWRGMKEGR